MGNNHLLSSSRQTFIGLSLLITLASRLIPHPPNMTALTSIALLAGIQLNRLTLFAAVSANVLLSDLILAAVHGYPAAGYWTAFTWSGYLMVANIGKLLPTGQSWTKLSLLSSLWFWLWTNFGVWLMDGGYPLTFQGLAQCYYMALPFLILSTCGDLLWLGIMLYGMRCVPQHLREKSR